MGKQKKGTKQNRFRTILKALKMELREHRSSFLVYFVLRILVIVMLVLQILNRNYENAFLCILTLILLIMPSLVQVTFKIELPSGGKGAAGRDSTGNAGAADGDSESGGAAKKSSQEGRAHQKKLKFSFKEQREWDTIEDEIAGLEADLETLDGQIAESATNYGRLNLTGIS